MILEKDRNEETPFAVRDNALEMRQRITELSFRRFGKKPREMPRTPSNWDEWSEKSQQGWLEREERKLREAEQFDEWFIANERYVLDRICREIVFNIDKANTLNPQYDFEYDEQRLLQDKAIGLCFNLKRELDYIIVTMPTNKNFATKTIPMIKREINLLRGWRKSCDEKRKKNIG